MRRHADRALLQRPEVRGLLGESAGRHYARAAGWSALLLLAAFLLSNLVTFETSWAQQTNYHHWPQAPHGAVTLQPCVVDGQPVVTTVSFVWRGQAAASITFQAAPVAFQAAPVAFQAAPGAAYPWQYLSKIYLRQWGREDAARKRGVSGTFIVVPVTDATGPLVELDTTQDKPKLLARSLTDLAHPWDTHLDPKAAFGLGYVPVVAENYLAYVTAQEDGARMVVHVINLQNKDESLREEGSLTLDGHERLGQVTLLPPRGSGKVRVLLQTFAAPTTNGAAVGGPRLKQQLSVWTPGASRTVLATDDDGPVPFCAGVDPATGRFAVLGPAAQGKLAIRLWSADSTDPVAETEFNDLPRYRNASLHFPPGGQYVEVFGLTGSQPGFPMEVRNTSDLSPARFFPDPPGKDSRTIYGRGGEIWLAWSEEDQTAVFWNLRSKPIEVKGLDLAMAGRRVVLSKNGDIALALVVDVSSKQDTRVPQVALWNLAPEKKQVGTTQGFPGGVYAADFTLEGDAFFVRKEGGGLTVFRATDGQKVAELVGVGGDDQVVYYDGNNVINVWTSEGRVLRYKRKSSTWVTRLFAWPPDEAMTGECVDPAPEPWEDQIPPGPVRVAPPTQFVAAQ